ncbi:hypothetical protein Lcho_2240 [Leptothrix cholodnii SP-6]|uniref:Tail terminator n=1 Tax=Leptothrix cholodnii (strain ATCC 51168 / LMG 8142 / SP-6) TaxID=395495 RepID=B1Y3H8_LEPCP|nr:hypothetical protein [Leptothrix cholodnii]ACB34506.1 hypothetical protein Lcho_2240 [Leptothrix cholodnii SP-6]
MSTAFTLVRDAVAAAMAQAPALAGGRITGGLKRPAINEYPSRVDVQLVKSKGRYDLAGPGAPRTWVTLIAVTALVRAAPGDTPDATLDDLVLGISERLDTLSAAALGAQSIDLDPEVTWGVIEGGPNSPNFAMAQWKLAITHETVGASLAPRH